MGIRVPIRAAITASVTAAVTAGLLAAPALAAPAVATNGTASSHASATAAKPPLSAAQMQADARLHNATGSVTGVARSASGQPLAGICVTAYGATGNKAAVTGATGRFVLAVLRAGQYQLEYRGCGGSSVHYLPEWYGGSMQRAGARSIVVTGSRLAPLLALAPVTLYPANSTLGDLPRAVVPQRGSDDTASDPFGRRLSDPASSAALISSLMGHGSGLATPGLAASAKGGRIAGAVTSRSGQGLAGICVAAFSNATGEISLTATGKTGSYRTDKLPAGRYELALYAQCGNTGNWLTQIYKGIYDPSKSPTLVRIKAGQTTKINATMKLGGEISGTVTGPLGKKLSGICVSPLTNSAAGLLIFGAVSRAGVYHVRGVPAGSYQLGFAPCENADYAPTLWPGTQNLNAAGTIGVRARQIIGNIDEIMSLGGIMTGTVTSATTPPVPLAGMCVFVQENNGLNDSGSADTDGSGHYTVKGLAAGSYSVQFQPGCDNNGNYVATNYPSNVNVTSGATTSGVNGSLPIGATISGTVTSAATGKPLPGICVQANGIESGGGGFAISANDGTYSVEQLPVDTYQAQFSGGCGNAGSYAPQGYDNTNVLQPQNIVVTTAGQTVASVNAAMQPGPVIAGTVTDSTGHKLTGICVFVITPDGDQFGVATTVDGGYQVPDLEPAQYEVDFAPGCGNNADLTEQGFRMPANAQVVATVSADSGTVRGINTAMAPAGGVSGVVRAASGRAQQVSCVVLTGVSGSAKSLISESFNVGSKYEFTGLPLGSYQVAFVPSCGGSGLETQWYKDKPTPAHATSVVVRANHVTPNIDSALIPGGSIAGRITTGGKPVHDMCVEAQSVTQLAEFGASISNRNGYYHVHGLNSGEYELFVTGCANSPTALANTLASEVVPQLVHVTAPKVTGGVVSDVPAGATISGSVLSSPADAQAGACAEAMQTSGFGFNQSNTGLDGTFSITNLPPGDYQVLFGDPGCSDSEPNLAPGWFQNQARQQTATVVTVAAGSTTVLGAETLTIDGSISGTVTASGGGPLGGVCVAAMQTGIGMSSVYSVTGTNGTYSIIDLPPGHYRVQFTSGCGAAGYKTQWWNDKPTRTAATIVTVATATATTGIGASMRK